MAHLLGATRTRRTGWYRGLRLLCVPALCAVGAAWRTFLGVRALSNPNGFVEGQFGKAADGAHKALALRCGLFNLQARAACALGS